MTTCTRIVPNGITKNDGLELTGTAGCNAGVQEGSTIFWKHRVLFWTRNTLDILDKIPFRQGSSHSGVFNGFHLRTQSQFTQQQLGVKLYATEGLAGAKVNVADCRAQLKRYNKYVFVVSLIPLRVPQSAYL